MTEILNGKNVAVSELSLPYGAATNVALDNTTPYIYVDTLSATIGTAINEHELVGTDEKIFSEGVKNAVVNITFKAQATYNSQTIYNILAFIQDYPTSDNCDATGERYYVKLLMKNKAGATVMALAPVASCWAACEIADISYPANDTIVISLTLRYGKLVPAAA